IVTMVGCSAVGCSNRSEQGYTLKVFPNNPQRRKEWAAKMHFEAEMWEKVREDGSRKLKWNTVPTIFSFVENKKKRKLLHCFFTL
ncbi:hypothetical protein NQ315_014393, partial [Exocentrus adspersus]